MTTTVTIRACCPADTEVVVSVREDRFDERATSSEVVLQDGQQHECYAYGDRAIMVYERRKGA